MLKCFCRVFNNHDFVLHLYSKGECFTHYAVGSSFYDTFSESNERISNTNWELDVESDVFLT